MWRRVGIVVVAFVAAGCSQSPGLEVDTTPGSASEVGVAWEHLGQVEDALPDHDAAMLVEDSEQASRVWDDHGFDGEPPAGPFDDQVVLLLGQADEAVVARQVIGDDLALLGLLERQITETETRLASLLPATPYAVLTSVPGWGVNRVARYGAAVGDLARWPPTVSCTGLPA